MELDVEAKVLLDSNHIEISDSGQFSEIQRYAVRILDADGMGEALFSKFYDSEYTKIRKISIWVIKSNGKKVSFGKRDCHELSPLSDLDTKQKHLVFNGENLVREGDIFAYEMKSEGKTVFTVRRFFVQRNIPVSQFDVTLKLPRGWTVTEKVLNGEQLVKTESKGIHSWKARSIRGIPDDEVMLPEASDVFLQLAISFSPQGNLSKKSPFWAFKEWGEVASHSASILDPPATPDGSVVDMAELLSGEHVSEWEKVMAVAEYVQSFEYIGLSEGISMGWGYIPHRAPEVLAHGYGDCKDFSSLVRSLLQAMQINSYAVLANNSGDAARIVEDLPCLNWFNHCIVAIQAPMEWESPAIIRHPDLGPLLIFDPTDKMTPFGQISPSLYGTSILVSSDATQGITFLGFPEFANRTETSTVATLYPDGSVRAIIKNRFHGLQDWKMKSSFSSTSADDFRRHAADKITNRILGARVLGVSSNLATKTNPAELELDLALDSYGQIIGDRLLVFKPIIVFRNRHELPGKKRTVSIKIEKETLLESVEFAVPDGFVPEEMPESVLLEEPFGQYSGRMWLEEGKILVERNLRLDEVVYPPEKYALVRDFFSSVARFENSTIVLKKAD
jgi:hypothetical protein